MGEDEITFYAKHCHATIWHVPVNISGTGTLKEKGYIYMCRKINGFAIQLCMNATNQPGIFTSFPLITLQLT
jgi:hypothetical protein